jgi:hypothetical protein
MATYSKWFVPLILLHVQSFVFIPGTSRAFYNRLACLRQLAVRQQAPSATFLYFCTITLPPERGDTSSAVRHTMGIKSPFEAHLSCTKHVTSSCTHHRLFGFALLASGNKSHVSESSIGFAAGAWLQDRVRDLYSIRR